MPWLKPGLANDAQMKRNEQVRKTEGACRFKESKGKLGAAGAFLQKPNLIKKGRARKKPTGTSTSRE